MQLFSYAKNDDAGEFYILLNITKDVNGASFHDSQKVTINIQFNLFTAHEGPTFLFILIVSNRLSGRQANGQHHYQVCLSLPKITTRGVMCPFSVQT